MLSTLALVFGRRATKPEARQAYEATLKLDPNNAVALNNLAFLLAETAAIWTMRSPRRSVRNR